VGEFGALARGKEQFQPLFDEFRNQWKQSLSLDSIPEYKQNLETLLSEAQKLYESPKHKNSYMVEAIKTIRDAINNVDYEEAQRKMDEYASKVQIELDGLTRAWDIFNDVREATGNVDLAVQLSGADYQAGQTRNLADALRAKIEKDFASANAVAIPFDINMSDKDIENNIKGAIPKESEERIKGIVEEYKKWRDLQRDVIKNDILNYSKLIGSVVTYDAEIKKINTKLEQQKQSNNALVGTKKKDGNIFTQADADKANNIAEANANFDKLKLSSSYINLMNNSLSMTKAEVTNAAKAVEKSLNERLRLGVINAKEYADEMKKLHEITQQFNENAFFGKNNPFTAFMRGGLKGSLNFTSGRIQELQTKREDDALTKKEQQELDELLKLQVKLEKAVAGLNSFATSLQIVTGVLDGFKKGAQSLSEMFDALGKKGAANTWSDISDGIDAASSIFAPANNIVSNAMNGNIGGVISSAISAPIEMFAAPITGFAKLHDKKLERQIEQLEEAKTQRENMISVLHTLRGRTLGYDNGNLLRAMAARYQGDNSTGGRNMYEYYSRGGLNGSGYQQELEALKKQREDTLAQLEAEEDKKKSSDEAIESYKKQIAEIDDQVIHFGEDLANSLWGIDIKGWADQITDALMTAFENGESAVKAYNETVKSIMQSVVSEMLKIGIIEPMMERLRNKLFGENGVTTADKLASDPVAESKKVLAAIGEYFKPGGEGSNMIIAAQEYMEGVNNLMQQMGYANGLRNNESANTLSSGIQGTSEETSDLLAGYVNALRQDVAINRLLLNQFVSELWPSYIEQVTTLVRGVGNIDANVSAIRTLLSENGAIYMMLDSMRNHFDSITNGNEGVALK